MASFVNSFALLEGEAQQSSTSANKKKKSKKSKKAAPPSLPTSGAEEAVHTPAAQPAAESDTVDDDGFQPAGKHSRKGSMGSFNPATPVSTKQLGIAEGITDLENAASQTTFRTSADRVKQWKHWQQQVEDKDSSAFSDGDSSCTFGDVSKIPTSSVLPCIYAMLNKVKQLQVLVISQALEITVQRCLDTPFPTRSDLSHFANLLTAVKPDFSRRSTLDALLTSIVQLAKLLPPSAHVGRDRTKERARALLAAAVRLLVDNEPVSSGSSDHSFSSDLPDRAAAQAQDLDNMGKGLSTQVPSASKEYLDRALKAFELAKEHIGLFSQDKPAPLKESTAAGHAVQALDLLLQDLAGASQGTADNGEKAGGVDVNAQELTNLRNKIQECEQVLEVLRRQARQLEEQMRTAHKQAAQTNGFTQHATSEQLDCLHALRDSMLNSQGSQKSPSGWQAQGLTREQLSEAAQYFLTNLERVLHSQLITLQELGPKAEDVAQKLTRAIKTGRDLQMIEASKEDIAKNQQHQLDHQKKLKEYVSIGSEMLDSSQSQFREMEWHKDLLHQLWSQEDVQTWVIAFTECVTESHKALDAILAAAKSQSQGPRAVPAVSLSHADPVVQPNTSPAGAIGTSSTSEAALRTRLANFDVHNQDQGTAQESGATGASQASDQRGTQQSQQQASNTMPDTSLMNGQHSSNEQEFSGQAKGRRKQRARRE